MLAQTSAQPASSGPRIRHAAPCIMRRNTYTIRVRNNRMCDCNLFSGDVIIIRRFQYGTHETASAEINHRAVALKRLTINRDGLHLMFDNTDWSAVFLHNRDIEVLSLVMGIEHHATEH